MCPSNISQCSGLIDPLSLNPCFASKYVELSGLSSDSLVSDIPISFFGANHPLFSIKHVDPNNALSSAFEFVSNLISVTTDVSPGLRL